MRRLILLNYIAYYRIVLHIHFMKGTLMGLPQYFCWSRFGTEAGQSIEDILLRKEQERIANGGVFLWGIGSALRPSMQELLRRTKDPEVLFSPIKSVARAKDTEPAAVAAWTSAETYEGAPFMLPERSLVTSRYDPESSKKTHYALVCFSKIPLKISISTERISSRSLVNLISARPVGASQVTAVVQCKLTDIAKDPDYHVSMRVRLAYPYFLSLSNPLLLSRTEDLSDWSSLVRRVWEIKGVTAQLPQHI